MLTYNIFNIQRFSTHDGEGIRTNIFFKGCPLHCPWCSNPESQSPDAELFYDEKRCRNFRDCIRKSNGAINASDHGIQIDRNSLRDINAMRTVCPSTALMVTGEEKSVDDIIREIQKDIPFYQNSLGGVTFTGGEPFFQKHDLSDLALSIKKNKIHLAIETCLHTSWENLKKLIGLADVFLVDIKHIDPLKFRKFTGGNFNLIHHNLIKLLKSGVHIIARVPVIPGFNFSGEELKSIVNYINSLHGIHEINFIPYHALGSGKYKMSGRKYAFDNVPAVNAKEVEPYVAFAAGLGIKANIGG